MLNPILSCLSLILASRSLSGDGDHPKWRMTSASVRGLLLSSALIQSPLDLSTDSSQGGGGIFVHAWGHYRQHHP